MADIGWIIAGGFLMSAAALVGGVTTLLKPATLDKMIGPLIATAGGTLFGGALFHMLPEGMETTAPLTAAGWLALGFIAFLALEQFLHWHHSHAPAAKPKQPVTYLLLAGDTLHNFVGGMSIASAFVISPSAGIAAWFAALAHEIPQELGDFGVLVAGGWSRRKALLWNFVSALTFPAGALLAYFLSQHIDVVPLLLFGAGSFVYIAASDLIPKIKAQQSLPLAVLHFILFSASTLFMFALARWFH